jgi:hypothetical protein
MGDVNKIILQKRGTIVADTSSLIYLSKLGLLKTYCNLKGVIVPECIFQELLNNRCSEKYKKETDYKKLLSEKKLHVHRGDYQKSPIDLPQTFNRSDASLIHLHFSCNSQGILSDDGKVCSFCKKNNIPYINTLMALYSLLLNKVISFRFFSAKLEEAYRIGRYSRAVRDYMDRVIEFQAWK